MADETILKMMKALSDPNRLKILELLMKGEVCACKLLESLHVTQPTLSHHMRIMVDSGLVVSRKDAQWIRYSINGEKMCILNRYFGDLIEECRSTGCKCSCNDSEVIKVD